VARSSVTVGVDLSAQDAKTWLATIDWSDGQAHARLEPGVADSRILEAARTAAKVGIDCPFGWPTAFTKYVSDHAANGVEPQGEDGKVWRSALANRATDTWIRNRIRLSPLSVSADRIGHVAFRCAHLLATMTSAGIEIDRTGQTGTVVEVYPAASLKRWGLLHKSYKGKDGRQALRGLAGEFFDKVTWLDLSPADRELCHTSDDAFDALIASLTARARLKGLVEDLPEEHLDAGRVEGWIALPHHDALDALAL
jgi:predicted nuclease with RNAse H fold